METPLAVTYRMHRKLVREIVDLANYCDPNLSGIPGCEALSKFKIKLIAAKCFSVLASMEFQDALSDVTNHFKKEVDK